MFKNWKTSLLGGLAIAGSLAQCFHTGHVDFGCLGSFVAGLGLLFAKDHNVTGGTVQQ